MYKFTPYIKLFLALIAIVIIYLYFNKLIKRKPEQEYPEK